VRGRQRLEVLHVRLRVVVDDDARVEQPRGVEQLLDLAHQRQALGAPLQLDERRHVAAGAVLGLQRAS